MMDYSILNVCDNSCGMVRSQWPHVCSSVIHVCSVRMSWAVSCTFFRLLPIAAQPHLLEPASCFVHCVINSAFSHLVFFLCV